MHQSLPERLSIELTNYCTKGCPFCYNASTKEGATTWSNKELIPFILDCASNGSKAVSLGGGEPLEYDGLFELLAQLKGKIFRSFTTNGLKLTPETIKKLQDVKPDKIHISIHFPEKQKEVTRVKNQVLELEKLGLVAGVNMLVEKHKLKEVQDATKALSEAGIGLNKIIFLPLKQTKNEADLTTAPDILKITEGKNFQSMSCLKACGKSPRFCAIGWDKHVSWCSYTSARNPLKSLDAKGLHQALEKLDLIYCGSKSRISKPGQLLSGTPVTAFDQATELER